MPRLSVWAVRAALVYLLVGFTLGALLLANKGRPYWPGVWNLLGAHMEFLLVGWAVQLAMGVGFWVLPRYPGGSGTRGPRGDERVAWGAVAALNAGVLLAAAGWLVVGRGLEGLGAVLFLTHAWGRVRPLM